MSTTAIQPPHDLEAEATVLGYCIESIEAYDRASSILQGSGAAEIFFSKFHGYVWEAIGRIVAKKDTVEPMGLRREMMAAKHWNDDYNEAIMELYVTASRNRGMNIDSTVMDLVGYSLKRKLIQECGRAINSAYDGSSDAFALAAELLQSLAKLDNPIARTSFRSLADVVPLAIAALEQAQRGMAASDRSIIGQPTGLTVLDFLTGGDKPGELTTWAARPGGGKSTIVLAGAVAGALLGDPQAIISLEMDDLMQFYRLLSNEAGIDNNVIQQAKLKEGDWLRINQVRDRIAGWPIYLDFCPGLDIIRLEAKIRALVRDKGVKRIYVDYLQLMDEPASGESRKSFDNENMKIGRITKRLKQLAGELGISIVLLSQMSRDIEKRAGERMPQLSDLRASGSIEQDSNNVYFLYSPIEYESVIKGYCQKFYPGMEFGDYRRLSFVVIAKQRNGTKMPVPFWYERKFCRMEDIRDMDVYRRLGMASMLEEDPELMQRLGWTSLGVQKELFESTEIPRNQNQNTGQNEDQFPF